MLSTANGTISARTQEFEYCGLLARDAEKAKWFEEFLRATRSNEGTSYLIWGSNESRPPGASWFRLVERRISESSTRDPNLARSGRWLPQATAIAALRFFEAASDLLPGEPYIYGSPLGDLVAEFDGKKGTLTSVIGPNVTLLFAIIGGIPIKKTISPEGGERELRSELKELAESLRTGKHGTLESEYR
jgi:hypothetical protein